MNEMDRELLKKEIIQEFLQSHSLKEIIREEIKSAEQEKKANKEKLQRQKKAAFLNRIQSQLREIDPNQDRIFGKPSALISIIEFSDFECPYCRKIHPILKRIVNDSDGSINWVFRHFPLSFHKPNALKEAQAAECAANQGNSQTFWKFTDALFMQPRRGKQQREQLIKNAAEKIGISYEELQKCITANIFLKKIIDDENEAIKLGLKGTPVNLIINHKTNEIFLRQGSATLQTLQQDIKRLENNN
ncbi:DsbA family protein [Methylomarinum vadi]|uniref:DsbA family protein n=1 Tax=Methylomarinum vadi TaxID=438855 RepID=UPI001362AD0F|nr:thioredoxin domain-containing protein [Methylomarinum vadi]